MLSFREGCDKVKRVAKRAASCVAGRTAKATVAVGGAAATASSAVAQVVLPDPGVDTAGYLDALLADTGTLYGTIIGGAMALFLIGWAVIAAFRWFGARKAGR